MADFTPKPKATGMFNGSKVSFNKVWAGHTFTDDEVKELLSGKSIVVKAQSKSGKPFMAQGKLAQQSFNGHQFFGFKMTKFVNPNKVSGKFHGRTVSFKKVWGGHKFTDDEIKKLLNGSEIKIKTANGHTIKGKLAKQNYKGHDFYGFEPNFNYD